MSTSIISIYTGFTGRDELFDFFSDRSVQVKALDGNDVVGYSEGDDHLIGGLGSDMLNGAGGDDLLVGDQFWNDETIHSNIRLAAAADLIEGGAGNDIIYAGGGNNYVNGDNDDDSITGGSGNELLQGGSGNDTVYGLGGNDIIVGGTLSRAEQNAFITAQIGSSLAWGFNGLTDEASPGTIETSYYTGTVAMLYTGDDVLDGGAGNDRIYGQDGADTLSGGAGNDVLEGGTGIDVMDGGTGNDTYAVDNVADRALETNDTANGIDSVFASVSYGLRTDTAVEMLATVTRVGTTAINLAGNNLVQTIGGNEGVNVLSGLGGNDTLNGNGGNDRLFGGFGNDLLVGGAGNDLFFFDGQPNSTGNHDTIRDFGNANGNNDAIYLENAVFTALATGGLGGAFAVNNTGAAAQADDRVIYNAATGNLYYDANGTAAGGSVLFATLTGHPALTVSDFFVI